MGNGSTKRPNGCVAVAIHRYIIAIKLGFVCVCLCFGLGCLENDKVHEYRTSTTKLYPIVSSTPGTTQLSERKVTEWLESLCTSFVQLIDNKTRTLVHIPEMPFFKLKLSFCGSGSQKIINTLSLLHKLYTEFYKRGTCQSALVCLIRNNFGIAQFVDRKVFFFIPETKANVFRSRFGNDCGKGQEQNLFVVYCFLFQRSRSGSVLLFSAVANFLRFYVQANAPRAKGFEKNPRFS